VFYSGSSVFWFDRPSIGVHRCYVLIGVLCWHRCSGLMFHIGYDRRYVVDRCSGLIGVL